MRQGGLISSLPHSNCRKPLRQAIPLTAALRHETQKALL